MSLCNQTSLKQAVDKASYGLQQMALLLDCAPANSDDADLPSSPLTASSLSAMSSISHGDDTWTSALNTVQVRCVLGPHSRKFLGRSLEDFFS